MISLGAKGPHTKEPAFCHSLRTEIAEGGLIVSLEAATLYIDVPLRKVSTQMEQYVDVQPDRHQRIDHDQCLMDRSPQRPGFSHFVAFLAYTTQLPWTAPSSDEGLESDGHKRKIVSEFTHLPNERSGQLCAEVVHRVCLRRRHRRDCR